MTEDDKTEAAKYVGDPKGQSEFIMTLMGERRWRPGRDHKTLAPIWRMAVRTVGARALIASKAVQMARGGTGDFIAEKMAELDAAIELAFELDEPKNVGALVRIQAEIMGVIGKAKAPSTRDDEHEAIKKMTAEEKIAAHKQAIAELEAQQQEKH